MRHWWSPGPMPRKLVRDLRDQAGPASTVVVIIAIGVGTMIAFLGAYRDMRDSRDRYYDTYRMMDIQIRMHRAPSHVLDQILDVPGLEHVEPRIHRIQPLRLEGVSRRIAAHLVSLPEQGEPLVNRVRLLEGRYPASGGRPEVLLNERFARARGLGPGDEVEILAEEVVRRVRVSGIATSPEFIYILAPGGSIVPDAKNNAVVWCRLRYAQMIFDMGGAFNELVATVGEGSVPRVVARSLKRKLDRWGVFAALDRSGILSHKILRDELAHMLGHARAMPTIFLLASMLVLNLMLSRLVTLQQTQIGTLKAMGVPRSWIARHYLGFALAISTLGSVLGCVGGTELTKVLCGLYIRFFHVPLLDHRPHPDLMVAGVLIATLVSVLAIVRTLLRVMDLRPAEAMRPAPPEVRAGRLVPRLESLPLYWRIATRNLVRHPFKSGVSVLGIALGAALMIASMFFTQAMIRLADFRFQTVERQDMDLILDDTTSSMALPEIAHLPGVLRAEPCVGVLFEVQAGSVTRRAFVLGIPDDARLLRPRTLDGRDIEIPVEGILMSQKMAEVMGVLAGDTVNIEGLGRIQGTWEVPVAGTYPSYLGIEAYADIEWLRRLVGEPEATPWIRLAVSEDTEALRAELARRPSVIQVHRRSDKLAGFRNSMQGTMEVSAWILLICAGALACGLNLNGVLVSLAERRSELAVLRVQGFRRGEIGDILLYEHVVILLLGLVSGIPLGYGLTAFAHAQFDTELYRLPWIMSRSNLVLAILYSCGFALISHLVVRRWVAHQDFRTSLSQKE